MHAFEEPTRIRKAKSLAPWLGFEAFKGETHIQWLKRSLSTL